MALYNGQSALNIQNSAVNIATDLERDMNRFKAWADILNTMPDADLLALGMSSDMLANVRSFRSDVVNLYTWYKANCAFVQRFCAV